MGRHVDAGRGRGLARWVIVASVVILVLAAAAVGYVTVLQRSESAGAGVCETSVSLSVAAGPGAAPALTKAAAAYNATQPVVRSSCVKATVTAVPDGTALAGLTGHWPTQAGSAPGMWIPDSIASLAALDAMQPDKAAGHPTDPFAWSPVVLAVRADDVPAVRSLAWSDLPAAAGQSGTAALPGGRHLLLALPAIAGNRATSYALQSVLAGRNGSTAVDTAAVKSSRELVRGLGAGAAATGGTTARALAALAARAGTTGGTSGGAAVRTTGSATERTAGGATDGATDGATASAATEAANAVPVVEADLAAFDDAGAALAAVHLKGPTVGDSLIAAPITAAWTDRNVTAAAGSFQAYLATRAGQQILADNGWRTADAYPAHPNQRVDITAAVTRLPDGGPAVSAALAEELGQPAPPTVAAASSRTETSSSPSAVSGRTTGPTTSTGPSTGTSTTAATVTPSTAPTTTSPSARGPVLTLVIDTSDGMSAEAGGRTLLDWVKQALVTVTDGALTDRVGLWAYSDAAALPPDGYPELVSTGPLTGDVDGTRRSDALRDAISGLTSEGDRWAYGALIQALTKAPAAAVAGRDSRIVLVVSGADETPTTPRRTVIDAVKAARNANDAIRIDIVGLGAALPADAYTAIAAAGGGEYLPVTDPATLGPKLTELLTPVA